jgi:hypothetical protein
VVEILKKIFYHREHRVHRVKKKLFLCALCVSALLSALMEFGLN